MGDERDCGDNSCRYATKKLGMRTNGGCSCDECPSCGSSVGPGLPGKHKTWCPAAAREEGRREGYDKGYSEGLERGREVEDADATDAEVRAHGMGQKDGYDACTADVVALLSGGRTPGGEAITSSRHAAEVIRRGDHVGAAGKGKP